MVTGQRKLIGLALSLGAVIAITVFVPEALAAVGAVPTLYGIFVAGNFGEHKSKPA